MTKYLWRGGKWVEAEKVRAKARIHVQSDYEAFPSPITGEAINGRSQYDAHLKEFGYHISEPGDIAPKPKPDRGEIRAAIKNSLDILGVR